jgi:hypothetical protein
MGAYPLRKMQIRHEGKTSGEGADGKTVSEKGDRVLFYYIREGIFNGKTIFTNANPEKQM